MSGRLKDERGIWIRIPPGAAADEELEPIFGPSCKPYKLLTCRDVHGHRPCDSRGCKECGFTGIAELPIGSRFACGVCWKSGKDFLRKYQNVEPPPDPPVPPETPLVPLTRKQRRSQQKPSR